MRTIKSLMVLSCCFLTLTSQAAEPHQTKLNVPWEELKKILHFDQNEVRLSAAEFESLLARTSQKGIPPFSKNNGDIILSKDDFKNLIDSLIPPPPSPSAGVLTQGTYHVLIQGRTAAITANLQLHIDNKERKFLAIAIFPGDKALSEILLDDRPAVTDVKDGRLVLVTDQDGLHRVQLKFYVNRPESGTGQELGFSISKTPLTKLEIERPGERVDFNVDQSLQVESKRSDSGTKTSVLLSPTGWIQIRWNLVVPENKKGPAKVYADLENLLSIEGDAVRVNALAHLQVLQNSLSSVEFGVPAGYNVIEVNTEAMGDWQQSASSGGRLKIPFEHSKTGTFDVRVVLERILGENKETIPFTGLAVQGAVREKGFVGVELQTSAEVSIAGDPTGLERVDVQELPAALNLSSQRPLLYGFRYLRQPYGISFAVERHEDLFVLSSLIDKAVGTSWILADGKVVHRIVYQVRNSGKQFLEIALPKDAQLWSVYVDERPAKPSLGKDDKLLIPLQRSKRAGESLLPFNVELVYYGKMPSFLPFGFCRFQLPRTDLLISEAEWTLMFPVGHRFFTLGREWKRAPPYSQQLAGPVSGEYQAEDLRRVEAAKKRNFEPSVILGGRMNRSAALHKEVGDKIKEERDRNQEIVEGLMEQKKPGKLGIDAEEPVSESENMPQAAAVPQQAEIQPSVSHAFKTEGVLPVRIHVGASGEGNRFTKSLIEKDAPLEMGLFYLSRRFMSAIKMLVFLILCFVIYRQRGFLNSLIQTLWKRIKPAIPHLKPALSPFGLVLVSSLFTWACSRWAGSFLSTVFFLFFLAALGRWMWLLTRPLLGGRS